MNSLIHHSSPYYKFAMDQDRLGFYNIIVGRLPCSLIRAISRILSRQKCGGLSADLWARKFSRELLLFKHKQWTYRNSVKHYSPSEGKIFSEHQHINLQVQSLLSPSPTRLLPQHLNLLSHQTSTFLTSTTSTNEQFWMADLQLQSAQSPSAYISTIYNSKIQSTANDAWQKARADLKASTF